MYGIFGSISSGIVQDHMYLLSPQHHDSQWMDQAHRHDTYPVHISQLCSSITKRAMTKLRLGIITQVRRAQKVAFSLQAKRVTRPRLSNTMRGSKISGCDLSADF